jgi:hypothetical protein
MPFRFATFGRMAAAGANKANHGRRGRIRGLGGELSSHLEHEDEAAAGSRLVLGVVRWLLSAWRRRCSRH